MTNSQGTKIEIDGHELSSAFSVDIELDPNEPIMANIRIPIDSIEIVDGKQVIKLDGKLIEVDE